jgi:hypothetical protein
MTHTFSSWLALQRERQDPIGDLARDVKDDPRPPHGNCRLKGWRCAADCSASTR